MAPRWTRAQQDLLKILAFRWPDPCYLVPTRADRSLLVVTELSVSRTLGRVGGFSLATTRAVLHAGPIEVSREGESVIVGGETLSGHRVVITPAGRRAIGAPMVEEVCDGE